MCMAKANAPSKCFTFQTGKRGKEFNPALYKEGQNADAVI